MAEDSDNVVGFEWDDINIDHLGERGVSDREVEQLLSERHVIAPTASIPGADYLSGSHMEAVRF